MLQDRRKFPRFDVPLHVKFKPSKDKLERYILGTTINFSRQGFCFEAEDIAHETNDSLELKIMLPRENAFVPVIGDIVWKKQTESKFLVGIKLIGINKEAKWEILDYGYNTWLNNSQSKNTAERVVCM